MNIKFGSVCSGIESASVAWEPLGWSAAWFAEIEPFPSAVLAYRWPHVRNWGDMTLLPIMIEAGMIEAPDVLVGGTPCQAFSIAGMRNGLEDERGQLTIKFVEVANEIDRKRPKGSECIIVWENVPGVLSSKDNAFGCFLAALVGEDDALEPAGKKWSNAGIVYGPQRVTAWRILDAQYFGVAQRRRRVFVIASARDGFDPAQILFEFEGVRRDTPPSREEGQDVTGSLTSRTKGGGFPGTDEACSGFVTPHHTVGAGTWKKGFGTLRAREQDSHENVVTCYENHPQDCGNLAPTLKARCGTGGGNLPLVMAHGQGGAEIRKDSSPSLTCNHEAPIAFHGSQDPCVSGEVAHPQDMQVRRLTPTECERLQGFPDEHTRIPWRKKRKKYKFECLECDGIFIDKYEDGECDKCGEEDNLKKLETISYIDPEDCPDGPRYKALGNSKAVPVVQWIGKRIERMLNQ